MNHPAPRTLEVILEVKGLLERKNVTQEEFRLILNEFLAPKRHIKGTHAGMVQLNRWLNPTANAWTEPMAEIILAFQKAKQIIEEKP